MPPAAAAAPQQQSPPPAPADKDAVRSYVCSGPLFSQLGLGSTEDITDVRVSTWQSLAKQLCMQLSYDYDDTTALTPAQAARVYRYYLPVYLWCTARLEAHREAWRHQQQQQQQQQESSSSATSSLSPPPPPPSPPPPPPLVIGLSAPQGCGKTTIMTQLQRLLAYTDVIATSLSIDDVYLTGAEQEDLAAAYPDNALLRFRGGAVQVELS
jgi:D-glycerate 3-kinase